MARRTARQAVSDHPPRAARVIFSPRQRERGALVQAGSARRERRQRDSPSAEAAALARAPHRIECYDIRTGGGRWARSSPCRTAHRQETLPHCAQRGVGRRLRRRTRPTFSAPLPARASRRGSAKANSRDRATGRGARPHRLICPTSSMWTRPRPAQCRPRRRAASACTSSIVGSKTRPAGHRGAPGHRSRSSQQPSQGAIRPPSDRVCCQARKRHSPQPNSAPLFSSQERVTRPTASRTCAANAGKVRRFRSGSTTCRGLDRHEGAFARAQGHG